MTMVTILYNDGYLDNIEILTDFKIKDLVAPDIMAIWIECDNLHEKPQYSAPNFDIDDYDL